MPFFHPEFLDSTIRSVRAGEKVVVRIQSLESLTALREALRARGATPTELTRVSVYCPR